MGIPYHATISTMAVKPQPIDPTAPDYDPAPDVHIVANGADPALKGEALKRLGKFSGMTNAGIARIVGVNRVTVGRWLRGDDWPQPHRLVKTLSALRIPRPILEPAALQILSGIAGQDNRPPLSLVDITREQMVELLAATDGSHEQKGLIFNVLGPQVALAQGLRAAGIKGAESADPRAATWFAAAEERWQEQDRKRSAPATRSINPGQATAHQQAIQDIAAIEMDGPGPCSASFADVELPEPESTD